MKKNWKIAGFIATVVLVLSIPLYVLKNITTERNEVETVAATFTGSKSCIECHKLAYDLWLQSDHYFAMDTASSVSVLGDFNDAELVLNGQVHKFYKRDDKFLVFTDGPEGTMEEFEVQYTFGAWPLQQYLVPLGNGKLQTLALTWDTITKKWYHMADAVYPDEAVDHNNWLHWTKQAQNWNGMCADCHSTNLKKGFDPESKSYNTTWSEINVGCEACHGPSSEHLKWANLPVLARPMNTNYGLVVQTSNIQNTRYVELCARCHTRRAVFGDYNFEWHDLLDQMLPELPREPLYFADGQILEEDYVFGSFTQSKMYMNDVMCNDCHNVHSGKLILDGNALCLQCHRADEYDTYNHHFHKQVGEKGSPVISAFGDTYLVGDGASCINCHMPGRYYMGVDYRRDHSFRIPRPDLSDELGTPNACTYCHSNQSNQWAANKMTEWYGNSTRQHFGSYLAGVLYDQENVDEKLETIINDELFPPITRAVAISEFGERYPIESKRILVEKMHDLESMVRYAVIRNFPITEEEDVKLLVPLLNDPVRAVRFEAAVALSQIQNDQMTENDRKLLQKILDEYEKSLMYSADFTASRLNLGNLYSNRGEQDKAISQFEEAIRIDDRFYPAKVNLAMIYNQKGENDKAEKLFKEVIRSEPEQYMIQYSLGLLLAEMGKYEEAVSYLEIAANHIPENPRIVYNLAQLQVFLKQYKKAESNYKKLLDLSPETPEYLMAIIELYVNQGDFKNAKPYVIKVNELFPDDAQSKQLLEFVNSKLE
ncbi:MAG: tetratricopeptide repeat protein [Bacteroidales bacterium]|nr:tetratricopeptide repeat protein [Bacteroidales bacterium]